MAVTKVTSIVDQAGTILNDVGAVRWTRLELQKWINAAYREIVRLRPDANAISATVTLAAGIRQKLADAASINLPNATRLLDVVRNMAATSNKYPIKLVDQDTIDQLYPGWMVETASVSIAHWMFNLLLPKEFLVYPPATSAAQVEIVYSSVPAAHALSDSELNPTGGSSDVIRIDDIYAGSILDYVLYRAYLKDAEAGNADRAAHHLAAFNGELGQQTSTDVAVTEQPQGKGGR